MDDYEAYLDENDDLLPHNEILSMALSMVPNHPTMIEQVVREELGRWKGRVEFTPPYWPQCVSVELLWQNLKSDFRMQHKKTGKVPDHVKKFLSVVKPEDVENFWRHTDEFCMKIADKHEATLTELEISL